MAEPTTKIDAAEAPASTSTDVADLLKGIVATLGRVMERQSALELQVVTLEAKVAVLEAPGSTTGRPALPIKSATGDRRQCGARPEPGIQRR